MKKLPDIALTGKAGAGKSTAAGILEQFDYEPYRFAGPIKRIAVQLWGPEAETDRRKLQGLGVAVREIEPDTWADLLVTSIRRHREEVAGYDMPSTWHAPPIVVDDLRFPNEWTALQAEGFVIVRVEADRSVRMDRLWRNGKLQDESQLEHESETAVDHLVPDYIIENSRDSEFDLYDALGAVLLREAKRR